MLDKAISIPWPFILKRLPFCRGSDFQQKLIRIFLKMPNAAPRNDFFDGMSYSPGEDEN
jgi:hypothetical protein